ncbi:MAG TPA: lytic transglycosylase domain-containing protein [Gaiellaceae bacterium]|nr:lytic transglycosylase domain-containing protein [Gaiellaceae bacterium]
MVAALPAPTTPIPRSPAAIVVALNRTSEHLAQTIGQWDKSMPPPRAVVLLALYEQRTIRVLARDQRLAHRVDRLDPDVRNDVVAATDLFQLSKSTPHPLGRPHLGAPARAARLLTWYREAQRRFHIRWQLVAAINFVESAFNKVRNTSGAGAQGPMQFEPATWKAYGLGGNIDDPHDSIVAAANYLAANGAVHDEREALYHYNPSRLYVDAISRYADQMQKDRRAFYAYYSWQVFWRTSSGDRRLTGPR